MKTPLLVAFAIATFLFPAAAQTDAERERCGRICAQTGIVCFLGKMSDPGPGASADYVRECRACLGPACGAPPVAPRTPSQPQAPVVTCPGATDKATVGITWTPGKEIRDYTLKVGLAPYDDKIAVIGPLRATTSTQVDNIPVGATVHVTLISYSNDGNEMAPSVCSFTSLGEAGVLFMRVTPATTLSGSFLRAGPATSADACSAACKADPACQAFTFGNTAVPPEYRPYCELKSTPGIASPNNCCVSGVKAPRSSHATPPTQIPNIAGRWTFNLGGQMRTVLIELSGNNVTFIDPSNSRVQGRIEGGKVVVDYWRAQGTVVRGGDQINWSSGDTWTRAEVQQPRGPAPLQPPIQRFAPDGDWIGSDGSAVRFEAGPSGTWNVTYWMSNGSTGRMSLVWNGRGFTGAYQTFDRNGRVVSRGNQELVIGGEGTLTGPWRSEDGRSGTWVLKRR